MMRTHTTLQLILSVLLVAVIASPTSAQGPCSRGPTTIRGQVLDADGQPVEALMMAARDRCTSLTDADGRFTFSTIPSDSVLVSSRPLGYCVRPTWVHPRPRGVTTLELQAVLLRSSMDDTRLIVHGWPYMPNGYEAFRCLAESGTPPEPGVGDRVPTPDRALEWALNHPEARSVLELAAAHHDVVPLWLQYGRLEGPPPAAPILYEPGGDRSKGYLYVVVLTASHRQLQLQTGYVDYSIRSRTGADELGLRIQWTNDGSGWDDGTVLDRWEPQPDPPPRPLTPGLFDIMAGAVNALAEDFPDDATLCVKLADERLLQAPAPAGLLEALQADSRTVSSLSDCPMWFMPQSFDRQGRPIDTPPGPGDPGYNDRYYFIVARPVDQGSGVELVRFTLIHGRDGWQYDCPVQTEGTEPGATCTLMSTFAND